jgi:hypothetical protein
LAILGSGLTLGPDSNSITCVSPTAGVRGVCHHAQPLVGMGSC